MRKPKIPAEFFLHLGATLAANVLTVAFVWAFWTVSRQEKNSRPKALPLYTITAVFTVILIGLWQAGFTV